MQNGAAIAGAGHNVAQLASNVLDSSRGQGVFDGFRQDINNHAVGDRIPGLPCLFASKYHPKLVSVRIFARMALNIWHKNLLLSCT